MSRVASVALVGLVGVVDANHGHKSTEGVISRETVGLIPEAVANFNEEGLPSEFDWRNVNGDNYVTNDWNQHIPKYCGACWIHGTLSALNDRIKVYRGGKYPDVMLGRQSVVNCVKQADGSDAGCNGGDAWLIHDYMSKKPIPDETCMPYRAENMECNAKDMCRNCLGGNCWAVDNWVGYGVSSYGKVSGEKAMMKEIYARGPIVCSFATDQVFMFKYPENVIQNEGVYVPPEWKNVSQIDHDMEVTGWGETPGGIKYWVVRNSWGTYWGEAGWLKLLRGSNQLQSESDCAWAIPNFDDMERTLEGKVMGDYHRGLLPLEEVEEILISNLTRTPKAVTLAVQTKQAEVHHHVRSAAAVSFAFFGGLVSFLAAYGFVQLTARPNARQQPLLQTE